MADTVDSKSAVARRVGSSPTIRIYYLNNKARNPTDLDGGMNGIRSNYYKLLEKQN